MPQKYALLRRIDRNEPITKQHHSEFLFHLEFALLQALHEQGRLNIMQLRRAEEELAKQRREQAKHILKTGDRT